MSKHMGDVPCIDRDPPDGTRPTFVVSTSSDGVEIQVGTETWTLSPEGARAFAVLLGRAAFEVEHCAQCFLPMHNFLRIF